jgi:ubiquinone/menaquinone biosynthesis C-methylase UbiE
MPMNEMPPFDSIADEYDKSFSESLIGQEQRQLSRHWLTRILQGEKKLQILEINCGTGDDALWLASVGHTVIATDQSTAMIHEAEQKLSVSGQKNVRFICCSFESLATQFGQQQFDLIFSNFSGLNCVSSNTMTSLSKQLFSLLKNNGHFAAVVFGKYTWWETFYFLLKGQPSKAFRRWRNRGVKAMLTKNIYQQVYYYSVSRLTKMFYPLRLLEKRPVGLFIPPSYLEAAMKKRPGLFHALTKLEKNINGPAIGSSFADHVYLLFKKEQA